jgi:hypothetical protein
MQYMMRPMPKDGSITDGVKLRPFTCRYRFALIGRYVQVDVTTGSS